MIKEKTSNFRKMAIHGFDAVNNGHNFYGLLEFDISTLRSVLRKKRIDGSGGSLFAFLLKAIGKCLQDFPEFNSMINEKYRTFFEDVDINIPIEIKENDKSITKQFIIRNINSKSLPMVDQEIEIAKKNQDKKQGFVDSKLAMQILHFLPGCLVKLIFKLALRKHQTVKALSGTVFVTSVSMFSNAPGYIIPYRDGPKAVSFAIGSTVKKAMVVNNQVQIREMINITVIFNHDSVDGAPAARFINQLRKYVELEHERVFEYSLMLD